jgi:hypothetical protein
MSPSSAPFPKPMFSLPGRSATRSPESCGCEEASRDEAAKKFKGVWREGTILSREYTAVSIARLLAMYLHVVGL